MRLFLSARVKIRGHNRHKCQRPDERTHTFPQESRGTSKGERGLKLRPLEEHGFVLHKGAFVDALAPRYGWTPSRIPTNCECGASFTVEHVLRIRHNEIITATLLTKVCNDVRVEPDLQEVSNRGLTGQGN